MRWRYGIVKETRENRLNGESFDVYFVTEVFEETLSGKVNWAEEGCFFSFEVEEGDTISDKDARKEILKMLKNAIKDIENFDIVTENS